MLVRCCVVWVPMTVSGPRRGRGWKGGCIWIRPWGERKNGGRWSPHTPPRRKGQECLGEKSLDGAGLVFKPRINRCFWASGWGRNEYSHPDRGGETGQGTRARI